MMKKEFNMLWAMGVMMMTFPTWLPSVFALDGRIEISQQDIPFVITNSGSYVLTEDVICTNSPGAYAVNILANYVTLDLNGHVIEQRTDYLAIRASVTNRFISVLNGTIKCPNPYTSAVYLPGSACRVRQVRCVGFGGWGVSMGPGSIIRDVLVSGGMTNDMESDSYAVRVGNGSIVERVTVSDCANPGGEAYGIYGGDGVVIADCLVGELIGSGRTLMGVRGGMGAVLSGLQIYGCLNMSNAVAIRTDSGSVVANCAIEAVNSWGLDATDIGVRLGVGSLLIDSTVSDSDYPILGDYGCLVSGCAFERNDRSGVLNEASLMHDCVFNESAVSAWDGCLLAGCQLRQPSDHLYTLVTLMNASYVLDNHLYGWGTGVVAVANGNRIDRNFITTTTDLDLQGSLNVVVRNRANNWTIQNDSDDFIGVVLSGGADMTANYPWANIEH